MAGPSPTPQRTKPHPPWPRELHHAALYLATGGALFWLSFDVTGTALWIPQLGIIYLDLLLAWSAVLMNMAAWPSLWVGLRDLAARYPEDDDPSLAWRAFILALLLSLSSLIVLPIQYHVFATPAWWIIALYVGALPYLAWTFIPTLALHGIVFGRVARYVDPRSGHLARLGAALLFAVAATTTLVILGNPSGAIFQEAWGVGRGLLPAAAAFGYLLIGWSMTGFTLPAPKPKPTRGWGAAITPKRAIPWVR